MTELEIHILKHINGIGRATDSNELIKQFQGHHPENIVIAIESLCGATPTSGYILWHKSARGGDSPLFDRLEILDKGKELLRDL